MTDLPPVDKDESILLFLRMLRERATDWQVRDHWTGDLTAIGVASTRDPELLAYVSSWEQPDKYYYLELEQHAGSDAYETTQRIEKCALVDAVEMVAEHLHRDQ
jgi:hypothetical protein